MKEEKQGEMIKSPMNAMPPTSEYNEALDRVKVGWFLKKGYQIRGLVHVGANDGYEVQWYKKLGIRPILLFEPLDSAIYILLDKYSHDADVGLFPSALGNINADAVDIRIASGDGKDSSFLLKPGEHIDVGYTQRTTMRRWASLDVPRALYNCCVIDVQGMELDVLRGMDEHIQDFDFLVVECSIIPVYKGEASADEVIGYLHEKGFVLVEPRPLQPHDDVLFVHKRVLCDASAPDLTSAKLLTGDKLNVGSGQRPFSREHGWINMDKNPRWEPDILGDWNDLSMLDDATMRVVVSHHSLEHVGCGEADQFLKEAHRVLKPGGSLLVFVPDMKALAQRWILGQITEQIYMTNVYGAYMGSEEDRHRWGWSREGLLGYLKHSAPWKDVKAWDWRKAMPGANIAQDWWITGMECVK